MSELSENLHNAEEKKQFQNEISQENLAKNQINEVILREINEENAHDAEDQDNNHRHEIPLLNYESMSLEELTKEFRRLLHHEKIQAIKEHIEAIKTEFERQFTDFLEEKKETFLEEGGEDIDFKFVSPIRNQFYELYEEYKNKRNQYYKELEQKLQANLARRQDIISEIKSLTSVDTANSDIDINIIFKKFKDLREQWYTAGPIPREHYNDLWNNYNHHVERFYDYLDLNKDLREMDFRHNLEEKLKLIKKAEELVHLTDVNKAFRELQTLHKIWKEETGPVEREHREAIWEKFSEITKVIHDKRQDYQKELEKSFEKNLTLKREIIEQFEKIIEQNIQTHSQCQKIIKEAEALKEKFLKIGRVPARNSDEIWQKFKDLSRKYSQNKNTFYKNLKKIQQENLTKKLALIEIAKANQNSTDWEVVTPLMKKIQNDWREIGHVPHRYTDKIWKEFKDACNHYFDLLNKEKNSCEENEYKTLEAKKAFLEELKKYNLSGEKEKDIKQLQSFTQQWNEIGKVPHEKKSIDAKFNKIIDALYKKLNFDKQKIELIKYNERIERLAEEDDNDTIIREQLFIRRKIEELNAEVLQLENNLSFFSNVDEKNPLIRDVVKKINNQKTALETWKAKLQELKSLKK